MRWKTDRQLRKTAETYRGAVRDGQPTTHAVATALNVSHTHARNLVAKARLHGLLEPRGVDFDTRPASPYLTIG